MQCSIIYRVLKTGTVDLRAQACFRCHEVDLAAQEARVSGEAEGMDDKALLQVGARGHTSALRHARYFFILFTILYSVFRGGGRYLGPPAAACVQLKGSVRRALAAVLGRAASLPASELIVPSSLRRSYCILCDHVFVLIPVHRKPEDFERELCGDRHGLPQAEGLRGSYASIS